MKVIVIGCGLAGLSSAYYLAQRDAQVQVIDRCAGPALETSFANGSMITPSLADPWNAPGVLGSLVRSLGREDSAMLLRPRALPSLFGWGLQFIRQSSRARFEASFLANATFARYSQTVMRDLLQSHPLAFDYAPDGTLKLFRDASALKAASETAQWLGQIGVQHRMLTPHELVQLEPALADIKDQLTGGIHYPDDEIGNAQHFCVALYERALAAGVEFHFDQAVGLVERNSQGLTAVRSSTERFAGDAFVLAAGSYSWPLGRLFGLRVPVRPAKGYSLTVPLGSNSVRPRYAVLDDALHACVVPLGADQLRVAGTAEFAGFDRTLTQGRVENLQGLLRRFYPGIEFDPEETSPWCGLRPMTPDGRPLIGGTRLPNLYLCTGHGPLGWTMACGSGQALSEIILDGTSVADTQAFAPARFRI